MIKKEIIRTKRMMQKYRNCMSSDKTINMGKTKHCDYNTHRETEAAGEHQAGIWSLNLV